MTDKGSFMVVSLGLGGMALLAGFAAVAARRCFLGRIESLQRALEKAPKASAVRTDLPPKSSLWPVGSAFPTVGAGGSSA